MRTASLRIALAVCLMPVMAAAAENAPAGDPKIVPPGATLEELWNDGFFTEGVAASPDGTLYFSDIPFNENAGRVLRFDPKTGKTTVHCADSGKSNGLFVDTKGRLLACCGAMWGARALAEITPDGKLKTIVDRYEGKRLNAPNDLVVHSNGSVYFSDPRYAGKESMELDLMSVYRLDPDGTLTRVTKGPQHPDGIEKPNGVHISPDGKTLYVAETNNGSPDVTKDGPHTKPGRMTLNAFPIREDGSLGKKRVLVDFGDQLGVDGMTIDTDGNIYAAVRAEKRYGIIVYSPEGKERAYIPTPDLPTNCSFGVGADGKTLYITAGKGFYRIRLNTTGFHPTIVSTSKR